MTLARGRPPRAPTRLRAPRSTIASACCTCADEEESMQELKLAVSLFAEVGEEGRLEPEIWKRSEW
jgi:hypothetical protein